MPELNDWIAPQQAGAGPMWNAGLQGLDDWTAPEKKLPAEHMINYASPYATMKGLFGEGAQALINALNPHLLNPPAFLEKGNATPGAFATLDPIIALTNGQFNAGSLVGNKEGEQEAARQFQEKYPYLSHAAAAANEAALSHPLGLGGVHGAGTELPTKAVPWQDITGFIRKMEETDPNRRPLLISPDELAAQAKPAEAPIAPAAPKPEGVVPEAAPAVPTETGIKPATADLFVQQPSAAAPMTADELRAKIAEHYPEVLDRIKEIDARRAAQEAQKASAPVTHDVTPQEVAPRPQEAPQAAEPIAPVQPTAVEAKPAVAAPEAPQIAPQAPKSTPSRRLTPDTGQDLLGFIRANGGLKANPEYSEDVKTARLIRKNGMDPDRARELAVEAGYLREDPNAPPTTSVADFHNLVNDAAGGKRVISEKGQYAEQERIAKEEAKVERARLEQGAYDHISDIDPTGEHGIAQQYKELSRAEKLEFQDRVARGEDGGDILENLAVRYHNDLPAISEREVRARAKRNYIPGFDDETTAARTPESSAKPAGVSEALDNTGRAGVPAEQGQPVRELGKTGGASPAEGKSSELRHISREEAARHYPLVLGERVQPPLEGVRGKQSDLSKVPESEKGDKTAEYDFLHRSINNFPVKLNYGGKERIGTVHRLGPVSPSGGAGMRAHVYQTGGEGLSKAEEAKGGGWRHFNLSPFGTLNQAQKGIPVDPSKQITDLDYAPIGTPLTIPADAHRAQWGVGIIHAEIPYAEDESAQSRKMLAASGLRGDLEAKDAARQQLEAGRAVHVPDEFRSIVHDEMSPYVAALPKGTKIGALKSLQPDAEGKYIATFEHPNGSTFTLGVDDRDIRARAFFDSGSNSVVSMRQGLPLGPVGKKGVSLGAGQGQGAAARRTLSAELGHELVHAVWPHLPVSVKKALVNHSNSLGLMARPWGEYLKTIGEPSWKYAKKGMSIGDSYDELYQHYPKKVYNDLMNQEAATHLMELYKHGALSDKDIAPVKDVLDGIMSGEYLAPVAPASGSKGNVPQDGSGLRSTAVTKAAEKTVDKTQTLGKASSKKSQAKASALGGTRGAENLAEPVPPQPTPAQPVHLPITPIVTSGPNQQQQPDIQALMRQFASDGQQHFAAQFPQWSTKIQDRIKLQDRLDQGKEDWTPPLPARKPASLGKKPITTNPKQKQKPRTKVKPFQTRTISSPRVNQRQQGKPLDLVGALLHALTHPFEQIARF